MAGRGMVKQGAASCGQQISLGGAGRGKARRCKARLGTAMQSKGPVFGLAKQFFLHHCLAGLCDAGHCDARLGWAKHGNPRMGGKKPPIKTNFVKLIALATQSWAGQGMAGQGIAMQGAAPIGAANFFRRHYVVFTTIAIGYCGHRRLGVAGYQENIDGPQ